MNRKIPLRQLAEEISKETGVTVEQANSFIKTTFEIIGDRLLEGVVVNIPGLGRFLPMQNPENPVVFDPDVKLAEELNAPFSMFEPVEVKANISASQLKEIDEEFIEQSSAPGIPDAPDEESPAEVSPIEIQATGQDDISSQDNNSHSEPSIAPQENEPAEQPTSTETKAEDEKPEPESNTEPEECGEEKEEDEEETVKVEEEVEEPAPINELVEVQQLTEPEPAAEPEYEETEPTCIPEDEEEFVEYHKPRSRFGIGFLVGLITGLLIGTIALAAYAVYFSGSNFTLF